jgi:hypothetical protein
MIFLVYWGIGHRKKQISNVNRNPTFAGLVTKPGVTSINQS